MVATTVVTTTREGHTAPMPAGIKVATPAATAAVLTAVEVAMAEVMVVGVAEVTAAEAVADIDVVAAALRRHWAVGRQSPTHLTLLGRPKGSTRPNSPFSQLLSH